MGGGTNSSVGTPSWLDELLQCFLFPKPENPPENALIVTLTFWRIPFKKLGLLIIQLYILTWTKLALLLTPNQIRLFIFMERKMPLLFLVNQRCKSLSSLVLVPQAKQFCLRSFRKGKQWSLKWQRRKCLELSMGFQRMGGPTASFLTHGLRSFFFMRYVSASRPLILFMDGHSSHPVILCWFPYHWHLSIRS